jgi:precorrin-3B synthase
LGANSFILDANDPRRHIVACVGAPACRRATTDVRGDAARLASLLGEGEILHISGCAKGCARSRPAPVTLVGRDGFYDLVRDGAPWDRPLAEALSLAEAAERVRGLLVEQPNR